MPNANKYLNINPFTFALFQKIQHNLEFMKLVSISQPYPYGGRRHPFDDVDDPQSSNFFKYTYR